MRSTSSELKNGRMEFRFEDCLVGFGLGWGWFGIGLVSIFFFQSVYEALIGGLGWSRVELKGCFKPLK